MTSENRSVSVFSVLGLLAVAGSVIRTGSGMYRPRISVAALAVRGGGGRRGGMEGVRGSLEGTGSDRDRVRIVGRAS